jgi:uncharacterized oxidoreductase
MKRQSFRQFLQGITMSDHVLIPAQRLTEIALTLLQAGGFTANEAKLTAESLVLSNLLGYDSHGVVRVSEYLHDLKKGELVTAVTLDVFRDAPASMIADARRGLGQVQMPRFLNRLVAKAKEHGVVSGALRNCGHIGRVGEWADNIAKQGFIAFVTVNDNGCFQLVAPPGGKAGRTSTNPISFAIPLRNGETFMIDLSTSATAMGKVRLAHLAGEKMPDGTLQDADGRPTNDPDTMYSQPKGALLPMGGAEGYKGFALSMIVDIMTAGLSGGFTPPAPEGSAGTNNVSVTIWNPAFFAGFEHLTAEAEKYIAHLRSTPTMNPDAPIRLSGDHSRDVKMNRTETGIPLSRGTCAVLARSAEILEISVPAEFKGMTS